MRTINDIVPPSVRKATRSTSNNESREYDSKPQQSFPYKTLIAVVVVIVICFGVLSYFSTSRVDISPSTFSAAVQAPFTATPGTGDLPYEIVTSQKIASQEVKSTGTKTVSSSASGTITIYNTQAKAQKLIANTRFSTGAGLIYRIHTAVTVPAGTAAKPGSIKTKVYADKEGDAYNVGPTSFTIPGFSGTPLASQVYAKSSEPIAGGASGTVPVVDSASETQAQTALIKALTPELSESLKSQIPSGYTLLPGSATTTFEALTPTTSETAGMVYIKEQGTITAVVFPNTSLAKAIAQSVAGQGFAYQNEPVTLLPGSKLELKSTDIPTADSTSFEFTLSGTASLSYVIDSTRIAAAVAGKTRQEAQTALNNYPEVKSGLILLRPFWRKTFPQDPASISIVVATP